MAIPFAVTAGLDGPAGAFQAARDPGEVPLGVRLLQDVRTLFTARKVDQMRAAPIVPLKAIEEAPWSDLDYGKRLDGRWLAKVLMRYGAELKNIRVDLDGTQKVLRTYRIAGG